MQHLLTHLELVLRKDERLTANGKLLRNKVIELALKPDASLLERLLADDTLKKYFFTQAGGAFVFDKVKFQKFVSNRSFLPDSYTAFENKIGLLHGNETLSQQHNVALAWPYKDCILEGGQSKEDARRNEIFWNEVLAPEEIDRLLEPKVFTNFKKYSASGCEIPCSFDKNDNWIIKGNNLLVLHSLKSIMAQSVKLIYIDPPYNTGSDAFLYNDSFNHSTWLTFMKNRLEVAWQLLSSDGCLFIQTDDTEFAYLKVLCDELFGREHFREHIILKSSTESGVNAINVKRGERLFKVKENILLYARSSTFRFKPFYTKTAYNLNYKYEVVKTPGGYTIADAYKQFFENKLQGKKRKDLSAHDITAVETQFIAYALSQPGNIFSLEKNIKKAGEKFKTFALANKRKGVVEEFVNSSGDTILVYDGGMLVPLKERIINEGGKNFFGVLASDLWVDIGTTASGEGGIAFSNGKKPEKLLKRIIEMATDKGDIVLDYHLGSGTTAAVAHKLGRRYIGIEQMDYGENDSIVRLQNVINGDNTGISKTAGWQGGGSFVTTEMKKWNEVLVEKILLLNTSDEAVALLKTILEKAILAYDVDTTVLHQNKTAFKAIDLPSQKKLLMRLLDLNFLYVPYGEISDGDYAISETDKKLNALFYSLKIK